jgi:predicted dehydrogenase
MIRVGIMSFAHMHAHAYAAALRQIDGAQLAAIWDDNPRRGRAAAKQYGSIFIANRDSFLAAKLDAVIVCSENVKHRAMVEAAARAKLWILCEKPLATSVADARAMIHACDRAKVHLGIAFPCRFATALIETRDRVQRGEIGRLRAAACTNNGQFPGGWFADPKFSGGGAVMDHTVHVADVMRWITGREFTRVYCACGNKLRSGIRTDDVGSLQLEMDGSIRVAHVASWNRPASFPTWGDLTLELCGTRGTLSVDAFAQKIDVYRDDTGRHEWSGWGDDANLALIRDFIESVRERRAPAATGEDGLRAVEVTIAAYRSATSGQPVRL